MITNWIRPQAEAAANGPDAALYGVFREDGPKGSAFYSESVFKLRGLLRDIGYIAAVFRYHSEIGSENERLAESLGKAAEEADGILARLVTRDFARDTAAEMMIYIFQNGGRL